MGRVGLRAWGIVCLVMLSVCTWCTRSEAVSLDTEGDIKLGVRSYVNARVGTEATDQLENDRVDSRTFPYSPAGHLRQNRAFIEAKLEHDLARMVKDGVGPFSLISDLPFKIKGLKYVAVFRGEADSLYDWGPREYSTAMQTKQLTPNPVTGLAVDVDGSRRRLRHLGTDRERLFQAYIEGSVGNMFVRFGRQILSWGETDGFRLLDNINPIDSSFGGFLISLDERRMPLDMLRTTYYLGNFGGVISDAYFEAYGAIDNKVGFIPGTPAGSPWTLPNLGAPSATTQNHQIGPARTFKDIRGGGLLKWNMFDATFSIAHYYTYFDTPALQVFVQPHFPADPINPDLQAFPNGFSALAVQSAPKVQVTGATSTFAVPQLYSVIRTEFAYFKDEPRFRQSRIDPFIFHFYDRNLHRLATADRDTHTTGGRELGDSVNAVLGWDMNQYIRFLNPNQTFFFSTQFFFKRLQDPAARVKIPGQGVLDGEVLPVPEKNIQNRALPGSRVEPLFVKQSTEQYLQTLFIGTSFRSGTVNPGMTVFYDWSGAFVYQPAVTFSYDPFRFEMSYSILDAHTLKGNSGVSLLKDRDNVEFRLEYVI